MNTEAHHGSDRTHFSFVIVTDEDRLGRKGPSTKVTIHHH